MIGKLYIDGADAYANYKIFVANNGYNELVSYPPLKDVDFNDWHEEDGIEVDLSNPKLDSKEFAIKFCYNGDEYLMGLFMKTLSDKAYHTFYFSEIGRTYRLRLISESSLKIVKTMRLFSLNFADDFPMDNYVYVPPQLSIPIESSGYEIDDVDLSEYGISVLKNSLESVLSTPAVKENLLTNIQVQHGAIYDDTVVTYDSKDVKINCLMRANSISELWQNYDAFIYDLMRPDERKLYVSVLDGTYNCYYKQCEVKRFSVINKIWFQFSLTFTFTQFNPIGNLIAATWGDFANVWSSTPTVSSAAWSDYVNILEEKPLAAECLWANFVNIWSEIGYNDYDTDYSDDYTLTSMLPPYITIATPALFFPQGSNEEQQVQIISNTDWSIE